MRAGSPSGVTTTLFGRTVTVYEPESFPPGPVATSFMVPVPSAPVVKLAVTFWESSPARMCPEGIGEQLATEPVVAHVHVGCSSAVSWFTTQNMTDNPVESA